MSIFILIFRPRILRLLLGWDGLGLTSYLLVCYYRREKRFNARILTALTNRLGDVAILLFIYFNIRLGLLNYRILSNININNLFIPFFLLLIAAMTKRAQIPFSAWLPAAIAAPTPVSALVHSSTLVTAGVYLLYRFNYIIFKRDLFIIIIVGGLLTTILSGIRAIFELDLKKVIALSTLRQLGVIFFCLGLCQPLLAFNHLISHAYFKAILFIAAGRIIHSIKDYQDIRKRGRNITISPFIVVIIITRSIRLIGIPFLSGFYSKDIIIEYYYFFKNNVFILILVLFSVILTGLYSCRLLIILFIKFSKRERYSSEIDVDNFIKIGILILFLPRIIGGIFLIQNSFFKLIFIPFWIKLIVFILIFFFCTYFIISKQFYSDYFKLFSKGLILIWFLPFLFRPILTKFTLKPAKKIIILIDFSWIPLLFFKWIYFLKNNIKLFVNIFRISIILSYIFFFILIII